MKYDFDKVIDRRHDKYSYSSKWSKGVGSWIGVDEVKDDSIALFTADMDFRCAQPIIDALHAVAEHGIFGYSTLDMAPEYNAAVINWFKTRSGWEIKPEEIHFCNGTVEAVRRLILAFTEPGDGVIIQRPVYGPFTGSVEGTNRTVVNNQLIADDNGYYTMDFDDLEKKAADPHNKMLILCNPHNPVGRLWKPAELKRLAEICKANHVLVVADEIHGDLIRRGQKFTPIATVGDHDNIITCTAVNKTFNLAGLSCTNIIIQDEALRKTWQEKGGHMSVSPFGIAAVIAAYTQGEEWLDQCLDYLDGNVDFVLNFLHEHMPKVKCFRPEGTYIMWMDFRAYGLSAEEIHDRIYNKAGVLLEGGPMFDPDQGAGFERICVPSPRSVLKEAMERIAREFEGL